MVFPEDKSGYRDKMYTEYTSAMGKLDNLRNKKSISRMKRAYEVYLRGWFPQNKEVAILDIGCGWGLLLDFFKSREYKNIWGVDISSEQVKFAREITENVTELDNVKFLLNHKSSFDLIVGIDIIEHYKKDEVLEFLRGCYDSLTPGGRLILQTPNADSPLGMSRFCGDFTHETAFSPEGLVKILIFSGFEKIELREAGPAVWGIKSFVRLMLWKVMWVLLALWNIVETGDKGSGIYTRVFLVSAIKGTSEK